MRTKKVKAMGRYRAGYGKTVKEKALAIESRQRKKQKCPFCSQLKIKRKSKGIWHCKKCSKTFASSTFTLN